MNESLSQTISKVIESKPDTTVEAAFAWKEGYHKGRAEERNMLMQRFQAICVKTPSMQPFLDQIKNQIFSEGEK